MRKFISFLILAISANYTVIAQHAGDLDQSFGNEGIVTTTLGSGSGDGIQSVLVQPDGKIVAAGYYNTGAGCYFALMRYHTYGSLDNTFGTGGKVLSDIDTNAFINAAALQTDGKIVVAGSAGLYPNYKFALARYNTNGSLDNTFGTGGVVKTAMGGIRDEAHSLAIQNDGKIVVVGVSSNGSDFDFATARYNTDGSLDTTFGLGGKIIYDIAGHENQLNAVAIQSDGKIVVTGFSYYFSSNVATILRYDTTGILDNTFGTGGKVTNSFLSNTFSIALQLDGKIIVTGSFGLIRFNTNGSPDFTFGTNGTAFTIIGAGGGYESHSLSLQSDGKILIAGSAHDGSQWKFAIARYNFNGTIDTTFGAGGTLLTYIGLYSDFAYSSVIQSDGKILLGGQYSSGAGYHCALVRYWDCSAPIISTHPQPAVLCEGGSAALIVSAYGDTPITYQWYHNSNPVTDSVNSSIQINNATFSDAGNYYCYLVNGCGDDTSNLAQITVNPVYSVNNPQYVCPGGSYVINGHTYSTTGVYTDTLQTINGCDSIIITDLTVNLPPNAYAGNDTAICTDGSANLNATGGVTYLWSPAATLNNPNISNPVATPLDTITYTVLVTDQWGCTQTDDVVVSISYVYENETICLVTVDPTVWKNKIIWEKTPDMHSASYNIYKETSTNVYDLIGNVPYNSISELIDVSSVPEAHADKYKISVIDSCGSGTESGKSPYHKTINLVISSFGSTMGLSWTPYEDEGGTFIPAKYIIYRGTLPDNMQPLDSISGSFTSYNDNNVFTVYYYMVGVRKLNGCNSGSKSVYGDSFSNKKDNSTLVNINSSDLYYGTILISPNPMSASATLTIPNFSNRLSVISDQFTITDITGKIVRTEPLTPYRQSEFIPESPHARITIERGELKPGIYFVELKVDRIYRGKLVVE